MHAIFTSGPQFKTLATRAKGAASSKQTAVGSTKDRPLGEILDPHKTDGLGVELGQCEHKPTITARGCGGSLERPGEGRLDDHRQETAAHDRPQDTAELLLPLRTMRPEPPSSLMAFPCGRVSDFVEQRGQEGVGVQVVIDRDSMERHAPRRWAMVAELRATWPDDINLHRMPPEKCSHIACDDRRKPRGEHFV
jgi:hypothetical protein